MPVPATGIYEIQAINETSFSSVTNPPIVIAPNKDIRAHVMIVHAGHGGQSNAWGMDCYISQYVQNGVIQNGVFRILIGHNITEIILRADVSGGSVRGALLLEYF